MKEVIQLIGELISAAYGKRLEGVNQLIMKCLTMK